MNDDHEIAQADEDVTTPGFKPRPQTVLFGFLGSLVFESRDEPLPSRIFLHVLGQLGVNDSATRATLSRLNRRGLLERVQTGRVASFALTDESRKVLREGRQRIRSTAPFDHADEAWTLLSFTLPESQRDTRHRLRSRLAWAGFGYLRDGLWIAPGEVDLVRLLGDAIDLDVMAADGFVAQPTSGTRVSDFVRRAWDLPNLRLEHDQFCAAWGHDTALDGDPIARLSLLTAHWVHLLRVDPGLPLDQLPSDWPAQKSTDTYRRAVEQLEPAARRSLESLVRR